MSTVHIRQIENKLRTLIPLIDASDINPDRISNLDRDVNLLSRALAAYTLTTFITADPTIVCQSITDGFDDEGIDLLYYDQTAKVLYIVQSKWSSTGNKGVDLGEGLKFVRGVKSLIDLNFTSLNQKLKMRRREVERALYEADMTIRLIITTSSSQPISVQIKNELNSLARATNDTSELLSWAYVNQADLHKSLIQNKSIDFDINLYSWGAVSEPFPAYYGQVDGRALLEWTNNYGNDIFTSNIRDFKGGTEVNEAIRRTVETEPDRLFYYNNGITAVCRSIKKRPISNRDIGVFKCEGFSIVNGAQTVGSVASTLSNPAKTTEESRVLLRLISLEGAPEFFGHAVTVASNTQNRVDRRDFVSLDPEQMRLAQLLLLDGIYYAYRSGAEPAKVGPSFDLIDATVALACAHHDIGLSVQAKREVGLLWEDVNKPPYRLLFNSNLSATRLWRCVQVFREVDRTLRDIMNSQSGREQLASIHGNRFILHKVFRAIEPSRLDNPEFKFEGFIRAVPGIVRAVVNQIAPRFNNELISNYPATFFKNAAKCKELAGHVAVHIFDANTSMDTFWN